MSDMLAALPMHYSIYRELVLGNQAIKMELSSGQKALTIALNFLIISAGVHTVQCKLQYHKKFEIQY
jgi:hypothetical protein